MSPRRKPQTRPEAEEKVSTRTPKARAARKWPSSWMKIRKLIPSAASTMDPMDKVQLAERGRRDGGVAPDAPVGLLDRLEVGVRHVREAVERVRHHVVDPRERQRAGEEGLDGHLVGGVEHRARQAARARDARARAAGTGTPRVSGSSKVRPERRVRSTGGAPLGTRPGCPSAQRMGSRMSGGESCASTAPSTNSTIEWMTDCGCTTT